MSLKIRKTDSEILSEKEILAFLESFATNELIEFSKYRMYYKGDNTKIVEKPKPKNDAPDNRIPVPYARKLVKTVVGYMFKPGSITYEGKDIQETTKESIKNLFKKNKEPIMSSQLGKDISNYGVGYEYFYIDGEDDQAKIRFIRLDPIELIPIWDYDIDPKLKFVIRFIEKGKRKYITIYSQDMIIEYYIDPEKPEKLIPVETTPNVIGIVPFNIYKNTEDYQNDYYHVIPLIDAYDSLMSGSMNEFERFAYAYLRLVKMKLSKDDAKDIKHKRIFENLENKDAVSFLTKEIPTDFIEWMSDKLRKEIHTQSHIPDFKEDTTGKSAVSGEALDRLLYDFEFIAAEKEAYFKDGLNERIEIILRIMEIKLEAKAADIENVNYKIEMKRNKPRSRKEDMELYNGYYRKGITDVTLIENFATFVDDPEKEIEEYNSQEDVYNIPFEEETEIDITNMEN